ncbi:hypothetical protein GGI12_006297 [Dipsacomyces acuminosporus]|nr:hypothetical protein GGI12_006297 [Dipsacomyces acuminosporus]
MLHHANIDRLWWQWQKNGHLWTMDGPNYDNSPTTVDSNIAAYNEPIRTVMRLGYGNACYQYDSDPIGTPARKRDLGHLTNTVANLPSKLVEKWFPKTYKSNPKPATVVAAAIAPPNGKTIPYPTTLTPEWIKMHKYNLDDVKRVESDAKEFVDDMRSAGYKSPV